MSKRTVRLTESDLKNIIKESVERILNEGKTVNNKLIFDKKFNGKEKAKPGERTDSHPLFPNDDYLQNLGYNDHDDFLEKTVRNISFSVKSAGKIKSAGATEYASSIGRRGAVRSTVPPR